MIVFAVVAGIFVAVQALWARRLSREGAPKLLRWFPWSMIVGWFGGALWCWWAVARSVDALQTAKPGIERQTQVHAHVANAQHACMFLTLLVIVGGFALMMTTKRMQKAGTLPTPPPTPKKKKATR